MRIFTLNLNKVRHFYYSFLNCLCLSWNLRDLQGTHLSYSGVSPLSYTHTHASLCPGGMFSFVTGSRRSGQPKQRGKPKSKFSVWTNDLNLRFAPLFPISVDYIYKLLWRDFHLTVLKYAIIYMLFFDLGKVCLLRNEIFLIWLNQTVQKITVKRQFLLKFVNKKSNMGRVCLRWVFQSQ